MTSEWDNKNPDGCIHADAHFAYTALDGLGLCGCGYHDQIVAEVLAMLRACPLYEGRWTPPERLGWLGAELLLHVADNAGLIEHGTSIRGSWITDKGKRLLAVTDGKPDDRLDDAPGYCCSDCPSPAAPVDLGGQQ